MSVRDAANLVPVEIAPKTASRGSWQRFHDYRRIRHQEAWPDDPLIPDIALETSMANDSPFTRRRLFCIEDGARLVGTFSAHTWTPKSPEYESNSHLLNGRGDVDKEYRRRGLGTQWVDVILKLMNEYRCSVFTTSTDEDDGHAFLQWLGAEARLQVRESRLDLEAVDWSSISRWVEEGERRNPDTKLALHEKRIPAEVLPAFCRALSEMSNTVPLEDLDHGDEVVTPQVAEDFYARLALIGGSIDTCIAIDSDGSFSGITNVIDVPHEFDRIQQGFTGVGTPYRGHGLGKWLKAAMLQHVRAKHPTRRWVVTGNAHSNEPMLAINTKLGFRLRRTSITYQISKEKLSEAVTRR